MEMANAGVGLGDALMLAKQGSNGNEMWNNPFVYLILLAAFGGGFGGFGGWGGNGSAFQGAVTRALITCNTMQSLRDKLADKDRELLYLKLKLPATTTTTA